MRLARTEWTYALIAVSVLLPTPRFRASAQGLIASPRLALAASMPADSQLPRIWHSEASHKDFRVEVKDEVFRADWINIPAAAARQGASMQIECRRSGTKWIGSATVYQGVAIPGASAGNDVKMCHFTVRFEVDSITPQRITFHTEAMRNFDSAKCQLLQTAWKEFAWVPKK